MSNKFIRNQNKSNKGRILFHGKISMMKGIHYFADCRILKIRKLKYEFIAAGKYTLNLKNPLLNGPRYLGHLNKKDLIKEYSRTDVFVLPSLSDAFPISHIEAMACGIPVILTNSCGSVVDHGENGFNNKLWNHIYLQKKLWK